MASNHEDVLQLLKAELKFLEAGGYRDSGRAWRRRYVFEESPSCPNYSDLARAHQCTECWLMQFVPAVYRDEQVPCRFVQLSSNGVSVDSLYRCATAKETEEALSKWLHDRINQLEAARSGTASLPVPD